MSNLAGTSSRIVWISSDEFGPSSISSFGHWLEPVNTNLRRQPIYLTHFPPIRQARKSLSAHVFVHQKES
jgi:hypothetical protein